MPYAQSIQHILHYFDSTTLQQPKDASTPIMMIHGLGSSQNYWMPVISELAPTYRCIALDSYGAGRTKSQGEKVTLEGLADDVVLLMDELKIKKAVIAGHSMGGTMAVVIASKYPDRVAGIVPVGPVNPGSVKPEMFSSRIETVLKGMLRSCSASAHDPRMLMPETEGMEPLANTIPKAATSEKSTALTRAFVRELILQSDTKSYASHCQAIVDAKEPDFGAVKAASLILAGREDKSAPLEGCQFIHEHIGSAHKKLDVLEDCGHWHCVERPSEVAQKISGFCAAL